MIRIAFASTDRQHVNTHFGAAERFVVYEVSAGHAELAAIGGAAAATAACAGFAAICGSSAATA